ncbi:MAG: glycosyltransferase family 4 protein [Cyclobacteriaceae bacterium]|nr:glycosyltransferase family 4 protein [Cyclobacteriaceae bacterium]
MKVAIVLNTSWNIVNFRMGLIRALMQEGNEIYTIAPHDPYSEKLIEAGCHFIPLKMDSRGANPLKDTALIFELYKIYRKVKPDIILHFTVKPNIFGTIAASLLGIPVINNVCGLGTAFLKKGILTNIVSTLYKMSFKLSSKVFFQNYEDCKLFVSKRLIDGQKTDILPGSGINIAQFKPVKQKKGGSFTFLVISRLIKEKGILEYVEAIKSLKEENPHLKFQLLGAKDPNHKSGIPSELIDEWITSGIFEYLGTAEDVRPHIQGADCIVLPSYREGTPRTLLEAASMAKPIITTRTAGCTNVVEDGVNGLLCRSKDATGLAAKMKMMAELSMEKRLQMGISGREKIESKFDEKFVIEKYLHSIEEITGRH